MRTIQREAPRLVGDPFERSLHVNFTPRRNSGNRKRQLRQCPVFHGHMYHHGQYKTKDLPLIMLFVLFLSLLIWWSRKIMSHWSTRDRTRAKPEDFRVSGLHVAALHHSMGAPAWHDPQTCGLGGTLVSTPLG